MMSASVHRVIFPTVTVTIAYSEEDGAALGVASILNSDADTLRSGRGAVDLP